MKLTINTKVIQTLKPCKDRLDNWLFNYTNRDYTLRQFLFLTVIVTLTVSMISECFVSADTVLTVIRK